jgi:hypothetical protein
MLGTIPVIEVLALISPDSKNSATVAATLPTKRHSPHYPALLAAVRRDGVTSPLVIRTGPDGRYLADGHHRVAAAHEAGITHVPFTDDWLLATL